MGTDRQVNPSCERCGTETLTMSNRERPTTWQECPSCGHEQPRRYAPSEVGLVMPGGHPNYPTVRLAWSTSGQHDPPPWIDLTLPDGQKVRYRRAQ